MLGDKGLSQAICHFAWGIADSFIHIQLKKKCTHIGILFILFLGAPTN